MLSQSEIITHKILRNSWKWIFSFLVLAPVIRWFFLESPSIRFGDVISVSTSLGQVAGIVGTLLFSFSLTASYRNKFVEKIFGGLDTLYRIHHLFGMYGLFLLLLHPIFLAIPKLIFSVEDAMLFLVPFQTSTAVDFGIFSLLLFIILIGLTLFGVIFSYPALKFAHKFLGFAFLLGAVHGFMIDSDIASDLFIRYWVLGLSGIGVLFYVLHSFFKKFTVPKHLYSVMSVKQLEGQVTEIVLSPHGKGITHLPGQFAFFSFINSKTVPNESHPFTISSWMDNGDIVLSAKSLGDFTNLLSSQTVGELVQVEGPFGEFSYLYGSKSQVWVAGGIGVTPFVAMAEHILSLPTLPYKIDFFYSVRTDADATYHDLFDAVALKFPNFVYHLMPSDKEGYITGELLVERVRGIIVKDIFICGPPPMMKALILSLANLGIRKRRIHSELFSLLK